MPHMVWVTSAIAAMSLSCGEGGGVHDVPVLELDGVAKSLAVGGFDVAAMGAIMIG